MSDHDRALLLSINLMLHQLWGRVLCYEATSQDDPEEYLRSWKEDMDQQLERNSIMTALSQGINPESDNGKFVELAREAYGEGTDNIVRIAYAALEASRR